MGYFDDILKNSFSTGSGGKANFTADEIEKARKLSKKNGKTLLENLNELTGKTLQNSMDLNQQIAELNANLLKDFGQNSGVSADAMYDSMKEQLSKTPVFQKNETVSEEKNDDQALDAFNGIEEAVSSVVFGQEKLLRDMAIAFKRPFVLSEENGHARNCFFVSGPEDTGKHTALQVMVRELKQRGILKSDRISNMDLSLYPDAGNDNVFLQDLYAALMSGSDVIVFENYEACHTSYLSYVSDLVTKGKCRLSERYILQKGQLVNVSNSFASEAVGTFSAAGKYLVFMSTKGVSKLADRFGGPFVDALGDTCESVKLSEEALMLVGKAEWNNVKKTGEEKLHISLTCQEEVICEMSRKSAEKGAGVTGIRKFYGELLKALATLILQGKLVKNQAAEIAAEEGHIVVISGELHEKMDDLLPEGYRGELTEVKKELDGIVGLKDIKEYILSLEEYYRVQQRRREEGLKASEVSKHMIFTGNPGTGKTTIARIVSRYLKAIGVLSGGQLVEVTRADLVGRYVGHTAPLTNKVLQSAIGGVLFIDEAYSLYRGQDDTFGLEAIDTLVKGIEDNRDNLIVILAGYTNEMEEFLTANSGLESRFPNRIEFPDYSGEELLEIAKITAKSKGYKIDEGTLAALLQYFNAVQAIRPDTAGNGRLVRNKIEEAILNQSRRLAAETEADLELLTSRDFVLTDVNG